MSEEEADHKKEVTTEAVSVNDLTETGDMLDDLSNLEEHDVGNDESVVELLLLQSELTLSNASIMTRPGQDNMSTNDKQRHNNTVSGHQEVRRER